jgi:hypothetical protein
MGDGTGVGFLEERLGREAPVVRVRAAEVEGRWLVGGEGKG